MTQQDSKGKPLIDELFYFFFFIYNQGIFSSRQVISVWGDFKKKEKKKIKTNK